MRRLFLWLAIGVVLCGCAAGSGRQGTAIQVTGSAPSTPIAAGSQAVFVMTVTNAGPSDASGITIFDSVGNQLQLVSITCAAQSGATCPQQPSVQMTISSLPNGGVLVFSVTVQLTKTATGTISNTMRATYAENTDNAGATATATAEAASVVTDVAVSGTGPTQTLAGGSQAVFVMTVTNNGPDATGAFNVYDNLSSGLTLTSITCAASGGAACPGTVGVLTAVTTLPVHGVLTFTVTTQVGQNVNGTVSNGMTASLSTDSNQSNNSFYVDVNVSSATLAVSGTPPSTSLADGSTGSFTVVVTNNGPGTAQSITVQNVFSSGLTASGTVTCSASSGVTCPTTVGMTTSITSLISGGSLTFTVPFTVNAGASGTATDTVTVSSATDPKGNHVLTLNLTTGNASNGVYQLFAANGKQYAMNIDFNTGTYTITGNNQTLNETFTADSTGGGYTVSGTERFRASDNLIVGGQDFGSGVLPYVAAISLGSNVQQLQQTYDLVLLDVPTGGSPVTYAATARVSGNQLQICQTSSGAVAPQSCASSGGTLQSYSLTVSNNVYTATNTGSGPSFTFQAGLASANPVLLSAQPLSNGSQQLLIGVPDSAAIAGGVTHGATTTGDWIQMTLSSTSYAYTGQLGTSDSAALRSINSNGGPFSMETGNLASDGAQIYVMQAYPLSIAFGATGGPASGLLQVTVP